MSIYIKDPATDAAVRKLAEARRVSLTEAIRDAVETALAQCGRAQDEDFWARLRKVQDEYARLPKSGLKADKAFFDELSGDA